MNILFLDLKAFIVLFENEIKWSINSVYESRLYIQKFKIIAYE